MMTMTYSPSNLLLPEEPDTTRDRSAIASRRVLYTRLITARDGSTTIAERERLELAVKRCGAKLIASTQAIRTEIDTYSMDKPLPANLNRCVMVLNILQGWLRKLRKDMALQRRGKKRLIEASDALGRAHALSQILLPASQRSSSMKKKRLHRIFSSLNMNMSISVSSDQETLRLHIMNAARYIEEARETCAYLKMLVPGDTVERLMGSHTLRSTLEEEQLAIDAHRIQLDKHTNSCKEQFVTFNAAITELEIYILKRRDGIILNNADNPPPQLDLLQLLPVQQFKL